MNMDSEEIGQSLSLNTSSKYGATWMFAPPKWRKPGNCTNTHPKWRTLATHSCHQIIIAITLALIPTGLDS